MVLAVSVADINYGTREIRAAALINEKFVNFDNKRVKHALPLRQRQRSGKVVGV